MIRWDIFQLKDMSASTQGLQPWGKYISILLKEKTNFNKSQIFWNPPKPKVFVILRSFERPTMIQIFFYENNNIPNVLIPSPWLNYLQMIHRLISCFFFNWGCTSDLNISMIIRGGLSGGTLPLFLGENWLII